MDTDKICKLLDEISLYFYGCYRNAGGGTRACEKFHDYMCAVDEAKKLVCRNNDCDNCPKWACDGCDQRGASDAAKG